MVDSPYDALGLTSSATAAEIKKAYRLIARTDHPDLKPDDATAEARFKSASAAYDLLKNPETRARFDRGEIDAGGAERAPRGYYRDSAGGADDIYSRSGFARAGADTSGGSEFGADSMDPEAFFARFARGRQSGSDPFGSFDGGGRFDMPGQDQRYSLQVSFLDAATGAKTRVTLPGGGDLAVTIPAGATDGLTLRLRGKGGDGHGKGPPGDAYVTLSVDEDPVFRRDGDDIHVTLDIGIHEAVLGAKVPVPTIDGEVSLTIPAGASTGRILRLRGRGVKRRSGDGRGDQLVDLRIIMPPTVDDDLHRFMEGWREMHGYDPRSGKVRS